MKKKNKLIKKVTALTLVPKKQIVDVGNPKLLITSHTSGWTLNSELCGYCTLFYNEDYDEACSDCPMAKAGNQCSRFNEMSTWNKVSIAWDIHADHEDHAKLLKLAKKYNKTRPR